MTEMHNNILPESELYDEYDELKPGWWPLLDDILRAYRDPQSGDHIKYLIASLIKEYLLSNDKDAATVYARRFDEFYDTVYRPKFDGYRGSKKGWTGYLTIFFELLFRTAVEIQYDDPKQDKVIDLLVELGKLPPRSAKIFKDFEWVDTQIWSSYPLMQQELFRVGDGVIGLDVYGDLTKPGNLSLLERESAQYVNYHAFNSRCMAAGLDAGENGRFQSEVSYISVGLNPGVPGYEAPEIDCLVMAAAQYILIAGDVIYAECIKKQSSPSHYAWGGWKYINGPSLWKHWWTKLTEIAETLDRGEDPGFKILEGNRGALMDMVVKAKNKMVALEPELLVQSKLTSIPGARPVEAAPSAAEVAPIAQDSQASAVSNSGTEPPQSGNPDANSAPASLGLIDMCSTLVRDLVKIIWK